MVVSFMGDNYPLQMRSGQRWHISAMFLLLLLIGPVPVLANTVDVPAQPGIAPACPEVAVHGGIG